MNLRKIWRYLKVIDYTPKELQMKKEEVVRKVDFVDGVTDESFSNIHKKRQRIKQGSGENEKER